MDEAEANNLGKKSSYWILSHNKVNKFELPLIMIHNSEHFCFFTDNDIKKFAAFYRNKFPEETFSPKFHTLEDHVVPLIKEWKFPLGEQGGESIHREFKLFEHTNISIKPPRNASKRWLNNITL